MLSEWRRVRKAAPEKGTAVVCGLLDMDQSPGKRDLLAGQGDHHFGFSLPGAKVCYSQSNQALA